MGAATDATWEDMQDLHSRFPHAPAWGQADFQAWGLVRPPLKTQDCHNHRKPDDHELDGKTADQTADEQDDGTVEGIQEEGQGAGEAEQDAGGEEGIVPIQETAPSIGPRRRRPNPRYFGNQWAK
ncbi:Os08g0210300 [Oryza sativa Japonica Group]|uniref:Os08g0210300 protein n=1 Tax=Oryza sativa subsp. japonica TaxID=39947 RepID=Q0J796_ORYSJ|nr:Os08g0210300 [Oryza sativa Japonica Group]|eukprot:NP_001061255.1 Os08g0210300 [Oryza sativa Japonica Group]